MTPNQRISFHFALVTALLPGLASARLQAQGLQLTGQTSASRPAASPVPTAGPVLVKPSPSQSFPAPASQRAPVAGRKNSSMLDQPASAARVDVTPAGLTIVASNASLTEVIRQVALQTTMQVEGNSREERVFGVYGPGSPPDVLSALLYDSGYNVLMVGSGADGMPRRLVLSQRSSQAATQSVAAAQPAHSDEDDEQPDQVEAAPPPQAAPAAQNMQPAPGAPGQVRTPQQMLEELQKMHMGQQPAEMPREPQ